ncbi:hypothetical protein [Nocardia sp. NPDC057353]|uniref:hypothetical protein n=1 Tax=Nocardia sp. NPDC057353 TaxID=3346104 RepID=UPI00362C67B6
MRPIPMSVNGIRRRLLWLRIGCAVGAIAILPVPACGGPTDPSSSPPARESTLPSPTTQRAPAPPRPRWAAVGQPIEFPELSEPRGSGTVVLPRTTMTVTSTRIVDGIPDIPADFRQANERYLILTVENNSPGTAFVPAADHFTVVTPHGATFASDANYAYLPDRYENGNGALLFSIPASGIPPGTTVQLELYGGQPFGWLLS